VKQPSYTYPDDDLDERYRSSRRSQPPTSGGGLPYPSDSGFGDMLPGHQSLYSYDDRAPTYRTASPSADAPYRSSREKVDSKLPGSFPDERDTNPRDSRRSGRDKVISHIAFVHKNLY
jgi:hypothetical protein